MYMKTYRCEYCKSSFNYMNIGRHLQNCIQNPNSEKYKKQNKERTCEKCGKLYTLASDSGSTERFCSKSCRNTRVHSNETRLKMSESLKLFYRAHPTEKMKKPERFCIICNKQISKINKSGYCKDCVRRKPISEKIREKLREAGKHSAQVQKEQRRSKIEALFFEKIKKIFKDAESNKILVNGWDTDVFLPSEKIAIFWNGACHYYPIYGQKSLNQTQNRDRIKKSLFEDAGYKVYVIKDIDEVYPNEILKDIDKRTDFQLNIFLEYLNMIPGSTPGSAIT